MKMKKHLFPLMVGIIALSACTSEEVIDVSELNAISFENVVNKNSRAVEGDLTAKQFDNFLVYGYYTKEGSTAPIQIFNGVEVHKTENNQWVYTGQRYWVPGCTYYFYAYSCADIALSTGKGYPNMTLNNESSVDGRALSITGYRCDGDHQHDLVYAENESLLATENGNPQVGLKFFHALCKIEAEFTSDFPAGYDIKISDVYLSEFYNFANFNVGTGVWSKFSTSELQQIKMNIPGNDVIKTGGSDSEKSVLTSQVFLIPKYYDTSNTSSQNPDTPVKIHFTVTINKDGKEIIVRHINGTWAPQWDKAHVYKYNINITGSTTGIEPIVFSAEQSLEGSAGWENLTEVSMNFGVDTDK